MIWSLLFRIRRTFERFAKVLARACMATACAFAMPRASESSGVVYAVKDLSNLLGGGTASGINGQGKLVGERTHADITRVLFHDGLTSVELNQLTDAAQALAISESGKVVGSTRQANGKWAAFIYSDKAVEILSSAEGTLASAATDVDDEQGVVGWARRESETVAMHWKGGEALELPSLGGRISRAAAMNSKGDIVGYSYVRDLAPPHAFLFSQGRISDLGTGEGIGSAATDINDTGDIVGYIDYSSGGRRAMLISGGRITELGTLGGSGSSAKAINRRKVVVGSSYAEGSGSLRAFVWNDGVMLDLNAALAPHTYDGLILHEAIAINNDGEILCNGSCPSGGSSFLLTPLMNRNSR